MSKGQKGLTDEKVKKIAVGATVAGVLLVIFLVVILIIQFVQIGVANAQSRRLDEEIAKYEQMIEDGQGNLEFYQSEEALYWLAVERGWDFPKKSSK